MIILFSSQHSGGIPFESKTLLSIGIVINLFADVPLFYWSDVLRLSAQFCIWHSFGVLDIVLWCHTVAQFFIFFFIRAEFFRNKERCVWYYVKEREGVFDFRHFDDGEGQSKSGQRQ
eukprot:TRINITY_DN3480_c0_g2_i10.p1 TRINITY_DN3480_c0_g2~~TRINITY_DN3480_c0_g2_i10.p1  ORF type:complete len:117 (-),score=5.99 TRINITY_DN3480_c0_g2_i10:195-545(-)